MHNIPPRESSAQATHTTATSPSVSRRTSFSWSLYSCATTPQSENTAGPPTTSPGIAAPTLASVAGTAAATPPELVTVSQPTASPADLSSGEARLPPDSNRLVDTEASVGDVDEEMEEVHSCITLSSTRSTPTSVQPQAPPASQRCNGAADDDGVEEEEFDERPLLASGGSSASTLHTATPTSTSNATVNVVSSGNSTTATTAGGSIQTVGSSPSPVRPHTQGRPTLPATLKAEDVDAPTYRVLDSEPSAPPTAPPPPPPVQTEALLDSPLPPATARTTGSTFDKDLQAFMAQAGVTPGADVLSEEQRYAYHLAVRERRSIFITGGAGTGKSHLLRVIISGMPFSSTFVTATTGIAALNLSGTTLHSFVGCGVPDKRSTREKILGIVMSKARCIRNWRVCRTLIIDEVSMLEASFIDLVDYIARHTRNRPDEPFGGIQLILSGDFLQLPPVTKERRCNAAPFCFETQTWLHVNPKICLLSTPFRQKDLRFFEILNEMRFGDLQPKSIELLHSLDTTSRVHFVRRGAAVEAPATTTTTTTPTVGIKREREGNVSVGDGNDDGDGSTAHHDGVFYDPPSRPGERQTRLELVDGLGRSFNAPFDGYTILRPTRAEVETQNTRYFNQLDTEIFTYVGSHTGAGNFPAGQLSEKVQLRKGCRVMVIKNFDAQTKLVNGSTGTVTGFVSCARGYGFRSPGISHADARSICIGRGRDPAKTHMMLPVVAFDARNAAGQAKVDEIVVEPQEWKEMEGEKEKSRSVQMPLVLAYAITIHKSQGMSLTQVDIDFAQVFEAGQSYVALSRCTDLQRVRLHGFNVHMVTANSTALAYYKALLLQQERLAWQRRHTPQVVAAMENAEARSCTPYGYVLSNEADVVRHYGEEDSSSQVATNIFEHDHHHDSDAEEEEGENEEEDGWRRERRTQQTRLPCQHLGGPCTLTDEHGRWVSETQRLDALRRRITPFLFMADSVKRLVLREMVPLPRVRSYRLVMDVHALLNLATGPKSALAFDVLFAEQDNMMRVPLCVLHTIEDGAAYRSTSPSTTPEARTHSQQQRQQLASNPAAGSGAQAETQPDAEMLTASDVAAEALAMMERAKQLFVLDMQRPEQTSALPEPSLDWLRFVDVLPLLRRPQKEVVEDEEVGREVNFILNRDPRETVQHRAVIEYALYLKVTFGQDVAVCTDSCLLGAYALAWGLRTVSLECLL